MKRIVAEWPALPRTNDAKKVAVVYAVILMVMTTTQLLSFEKFIPLIESFGLPESGRFISILLEVCGVLALPFLLRMKLSVGFRWVSMVAGWIVPVFWIGLMMWVNLRGVAIETTGLLGPSIMMVGGWWTVCMLVGVGILAAWASWGLWPGRRRHSLERPRKK